MVIFGKLKGYKTYMGVALIAIGSILRLTGEQVMGDNFILAGLAMTGFGLRSAINSAMPKERKFPVKRVRKKRVTAKDVTEEK